MSKREATRQQGINTRVQMLEAIKAYITQHGYPPTVREICDLTGIASTSTVHYQLQRMFADGTLETDHPGMPRTIRVPGTKVVLEEE